MLRAPRFVRICKFQNYKSSELIVLNHCKIKCKSLDHGSCTLARTYIINFKHGDDPVSLSIHQPMNPRHKDFISACWGHMTRITASAGHCRQSLGPYDSDYCVHRPLWPDYEKGDGHMHCHAIAEKGDGHLPVSRRTTCYTSS